jgi:hypothetical protein
MSRGRGQTPDMAKWDTTPDNQEKAGRSAVSVAATAGVRPRPCPKETL